MTVKLKAQKFITSVYGQLYDQRTRPVSIAIHPATLKSLMQEMLELPPNKKVKEPLYFLGMRVVEDETAPIDGFKLLP